MLLGSFSQFIVAAAAKSLQSCPTLCDPIEGSPLGSSVPGILQARIMEWVAIAFSNIISLELVHLTLPKLYRLNIGVVSPYFSLPVVSESHVLFASYLSILGFSYK